MLVKMEHITMNFGPVCAVNDVSLSIGEGEIHGLLGENGAGKSTLMNILAGSFLPTQGEISVDDTKVTIATPTQAAKLKIRFIHQELNLCNDLRVFENIFLGEELLHKGIFLDKKTMRDRTQKVLHRIKSSISPDQLVSDLEPAERQLVEIAKALVFESRLIIMDEPTTALGQQEINQLFEVMKELKNDNVSFIYISHKMPEIFEICDHYTILRDGCYVATGNIDEINEKEITDLMVGKELIEANLKEGIDVVQKDKISLSLKNFSGEGFKNISFNLHKGEVIAITGLHGSGIGSLADTIFGNIPFIDGEFFVNDSKIQTGSKIIDMMKRGVAMVPRNRKEFGIFTDLTIYDNLSMAEWNISKGFTISLTGQKEQYDFRQKELNIKAGSPKNPITSLSGGNQQKVILGRWLETGADIYLLDNPTQGIDVGAKYEIYKLIVKLASEGKSVLMFTSDFPEIYKVSDRCLVLYRGEINADLSPDEMTEERLIYYSTGANIEEGNHGK